MKFTAYCADWIGSPISEQKALMFMMAAANEFIISAGGFIPASRETMLAVSTVFTILFLNLILFVNKYKIKYAVCLRPHVRSENILKKCSYELYTIIN